MQFDSLEFLLFALLFFLLWPLFRRKSNYRWLFLVISSFVFYGFWDWRFLFLIIVSGFADFFCAIWIEKFYRFKKFFLILSLVINLGMLSIFKYSLFFANSIEDVFHSFGATISLSEKIPEFFLILPIGISFYTFQSLSYTVDVYRGRLKPVNNILHFFSYLSMFPQLVAGPIVRAKDFLKQLERYKKPGQLQKWNAIKLICFGLFQKMVIADNLSFLVDSAFEGKSNFDGSMFWWIVMFAFSFQIYCDFSGYTLIARGLAKYMGYHFKRNFNHPYISKSFQEFWSRWHISLSTWFRDYVYIPLGGSRKGHLRTILAILLTMLLSGLWHGANYTFLFWAAIHSVLLIAERFIRKMVSIRVNDNIKVIFVFICVSLTWVYFRAENISHGNEILMKMFSAETVNTEFFQVYFDNLFFLLLIIFIELTVSFLRKNKSLNIRFKKYHLDMVVVVLCILSIVFLRGQGKQFIYFQF